jgi:hypothetical protein
MVDGSLPTATLNWMNPARGGRTAAGVLQDSDERPFGRRFTVRPALFPYETRDIGVSRTTGIGRDVRSWYPS